MSSRQFSSLKVKNIAHYIKREGKEEEGTYKVFNTLYNNYMPILKKVNEKEREGEREQEKKNYKQLNQTAFSSCFQAIQFIEAESEIGRWAGEG